MARSHLARIRRICLSLPEATEVEAWGEPTFRVGKIFVMYAAADTHHGSGREGIWIKSRHFTQDLLVRGQPSRYFSPPYVGPQGWTGAWLDAGTDWIAVTELIRDAYRSTAPRRLAALVPEDDAPTATTRPRAPAKGKGPAVKERPTTRKRPPAAKKAPKRAGSKKAAAKKRR